jgi:hypothetical protein
MRLGALAAIMLALVAAGCGGDEQQPLLPKGQALATRGSIAPRVQLFGDEVVARLDVMVDRERYEPERIRVVPAFEPYETQGEPERNERELGRFAHVRYDFRLRCLSYACLKRIGRTPPQFQPGWVFPLSLGSGFGERASFRLKAAQVLYHDPDGGKQVLRRVRWPEMQSVSRLNFADSNVTGIGFPFEASVTPLVDASYRAPPLLVGGAFVAGGLALLGLSGLMIARLLRRDEPVVVDEEPPLPPLERALLRVEAAREEAETDRRESLEALASELEPALADDTRRLAWSPAAPSPDAMDDLVEAVRGANAQGG